MHPVFRNKNWFAAYLGLWLALAAALAALLHVPGTLRWRETMALAGPLCLFFAFVCLTPWYMCRQLPLRSAGIAEMLVVSSGRGGAGDGVVGGAGAGGGERTRRWARGSTRRSRN